jgi:lipopolysaccharide transport system ATP-binding protein
MSQSAIIVENLSKKYSIGHRHSSSRQKYQYTALRDVIGRELRNFARKAADVVSGRQVIQGDEVEEFWALKDISFEVKQGEVLGIIGRNGAGKSTLLKILSRITEPTTGRVLLTGRVASLLEVGTGFHPELTGRENVFLNGAVLGMTQQEIGKKFDEIVAFAEVNKFLDTPVKHYSSGMYVRLAFAVAAHLEPEILIVDEVLAVGDVEFQKKCLGKMSEVVRESRTVLFVSHNMEAIRKLTQKCILLDQGSIARFGDTEEVIASYFIKSIEARRVVKQTRDLELFREHQFDDPFAKFIGFDVGGSDESSGNLPVIKLGEKFKIRIHLAVQRATDAADLGVIIRTSEGEPVVCLTCGDYDYVLALKLGCPTVEIAINDLPLAPGEYFLDAGIDQVIGGQTSDYISGYPLFSVVTDCQSAHLSKRPGVIHCREVQWDVSL